MSDLLNADGCTCGSCVTAARQSEERREVLSRHRRAQTDATARMTKDTTEGLRGRQISAVKRKSGITGRREGAA